MATYRITSSQSLGGICPPPIVPIAFPAFDGEPCTLSADGLTCEVTFANPQPIPDLGLLFKVEAVTA